MSSINKAIIIGHLGKAPQISTFQNGGKIASFTVATSESWTDKQTGEKKEATEWHNVVIASPALVDIVERYLQKGSQVYIEGKIRTRKYNDKSGAERQITEIVVGQFGGQIALLDKRGNASETHAEPQEQTTETQQAAPVYNDLDDDIPF